MPDLAREANMLGALLEETRGVVGVTLGTAGGQLRAVVGSVADGDASAAVAASLTDELSKLGSLLGLGELGVASLKAATAARVFARQAGAAVVIELDPKRPLGELETKLRTRAWAPEEDSADLAVNRVPTKPSHERSERATLPPPPPRPNRPSPPPVAASVLPRPTLPPPPPPPTRPPPKNGVSRSNPPTPSPVVSVSARPISPAVSLQSQMKAVGSGPVFTGDLEEFCLPDLLEFLRNSHRTGLLKCTTVAGVGTIQLSRGMIIGAESPNALDLRQHFLTSPEVDPDRRRALAALPAECFGDELIEGVLIARDLAARDQVERARTARIYSAFREMVGWTAGRFSFDPGVPIVTNPALALSAQAILMQIYQEQDEQGR
jgi:hypothetical protein